jgi:DnaJ-class molecular chaperone
MIEIHIFLCYPFSFQKVFWNFFTQYKWLIFLRPVNPKIHNADGHGYPANAKASICPTCRGVGKVSVLRIYSDYN